MDKPKIGISIGDINGIGLEVILKTLQHKNITELCTPVVYGSSKVISYHKNIVGVDFQFHQTRSAEKLHTDKINIVNCWQENVNISLGKPSELGGHYAALSLEAATRELLAGFIDGLVTAPINKHAMQMTNFPFPGHTEYLTREMGVPESLMLMVNDDLRIGLVTNHLPIREVAEAISKAAVLRKLEILNDALRKDFAIERPTIAVLGLNPHAGDGGVLGDEEDLIIRPAVVEMKKKGMLVMGPFPTDGFFGSRAYAKYDGILAMYHDQGLAPFKTLSFGKGVNYTAGLPFVRTSPDHGTAYDIAGKNAADPASFQQALFTAIDVVRNRKDYAEMHANALVNKQYEASEDEIIEDDAEDED